MHKIILCLNWSAPSEGEIEKSSLGLAALTLQYEPLRWTTHELISANCFFNSMLVRNLFTFMFGGHGLMLTKVTRET